MSDLFVWVVVVAAFLLRVGYNLALHADGHPPGSFVIDEREYFGAAHMLAEGRGFSFFDTALWTRPPLYVLFLSPLMRFSDNSTVLVLIAQSLLSAGTLLPLAYLAYRVGGLGAARVAALLGAFYLPFTLFAGLLLSETLFVTLFALTLVALARAHDTLANDHRRSSVVGRRSSIVASGVLLGLCALTRSTALAFVPLAALWLLFSTPRSVAVGRRLALVGALLVVCGLALLPWIARNYVAYGRLVALDTTSGYNLWLGSVGVRDEERLQADLRAIPNPADRQSFAYARAWENISADPAAFVRKGLKESLDLWQPLFGAEERQVNGYTLGRVPGWHLLSLLLFDDLLYLAILLLAALGLFLAPPQPLRSLTLLWALLWVAMSFVFFAVTRFRLPVMAALVPWAGVGAGVLLRAGQLTGRLRQTPIVARIALPVILLTIFALVVPPVISSLSSVQLGVERWAQQEPYRRAETLLRNSKPKEAINLYNQANFELADTRYGLAAALLQTGKATEALSLLKPSEPADRYEPFIIRGEAARLTGDLEAARTLLNERVVKLAGDSALQWAWDHLYPPVVSSLDIGSGLEVGYIRGFHSPENDASGATFRWTGEHAQVRQLGIPGAEASGTLRFSLSGWRPDALPPATITFNAGPPPLSARHPQFILANNKDWETIEAPRASNHVDAVAIGTTLNTNTFIAAGSDPRLVGVRVARVSVER